jgi:hypothetical protein
VELFETHCLSRLLGAGKKYRTMQVFGSPMGVRARRELLQKTPPDKTCIVRYFLPAPSISLLLHEMRGDNADAARFRKVRHLIVTTLGHGYI